MRQKFFNEKLQQVLDQLKPGYTVQMEMAPKPRPGTRPFDEIQSQSKQAGVLILLYPYQQEIYLVLTQRTNHVAHHKDQISLPGGHVEKQENPEHAALRETREELGVDLKEVQVLGPLTPLYIPPSEYCAHPYVAWINKKPFFHPSPQEVSEILEIPVSYFSDSKNVHEERWVVRGTAMDVPFYSFGNHKIWGATAMILSEFLWCLKRAKWS